MKNKKKKNKLTKFKRILKNKKIIISLSVIIFITLFVLFVTLIHNVINKNIIDKKNKKSNDTKIIKVEDVTTTNKVKIVDTTSNTRNVAVMINNISTVWGYQSGLQDAYIVYEIIVEGGISRLMAVYKDADTARIGSVRSSRPYFIDYVMENDAIYVHVGGSEQAMSEIKKFEIASLDSSTIWRDKTLGLATEHTAFTSMEKINDKVNSRGIRSTTSQDLLLNYSADEIDFSKMDGVIPANEVYISYSSSKSTSFTYDSDKKVYLRYQNKKAHVDYVTKEQYTTKNIITYQVANKTISGDTHGRQELSNIGSGSGYYISNGYAVPITWEKTSRDSQTIYKYMDGKEITVNDGNTYIEIQPKNRDLTIN